MKRWRWNIAWRMGLGFGVFILAVAVLLVITRITLGESRALGEEIDDVLVPSLGALEQMDATIQIFKQASINYHLVAGSALGLARNGGLMWVKCA